MELLYFTFGSHPDYPYGREDYVMTVGTDMKDCIEAYKRRHPNRPGSDAINCADYYRKEEWDGYIYPEYHNGKHPVEVILSDAAYGGAPGGFGSLWLYVPEKNSIVFLQEGSGDNLEPEDRVNGMEDYVDCSSWELQPFGDVEESEGGDCMLPYLIQRDRTCLAETIPDVLDMLYGNPSLDAIILKKACNPEERKGKGI